MRKFVVIFEVETEEGELMLDSMDAYAPDRNTCYDMVTAQYPDLVIDNIVSA